MPTPCRADWMTAISQRDTNFYDFMNEANNQAKIVETLATFFKDHIQLKMLETTNCTFCTILIFPLPHNSNSTLQMYSTSYSRETTQAATSSTSTPTYPKPILCYSHTKSYSISIRLVPRSLSSSSSTLPPIQQRTQAGLRTNIT